MYYIKLNNDFLELNKFISDLESILLEISSKGTILREIGFNSKTEVVHMYPNSKYKYGQFGIFDLSVFKVPLKNDINKNDFNCLWDENI